MSFLGLFSNNRREREKNPPHINTEWGPFYYNLEKYGKYEYESLIDWGEDVFDPCDVKIETDTVDSDEVSVGLERFAQLMNNKDEIDYQV